MGRLWTEAEDNTLRYNTKLPNEQLGLMLDRSERSIYERRRILHLPPENGWEGVFKPEVLSKSEKIQRIKRLALEMRVKLLG